jgi:hypothetical protein
MVVIRYSSKALSLMICLDMWNMVWRLILNIYTSCVGFEVLSVVALKTAIFCIVMSCSSVKLARRRGQQSASCWFLVWLILWPWGWRQYASPKCQLTFTGLHDVISQKIEVFIGTFYIKKVLAVNNCRYNNSVKFEIFPADLFVSQ